MIGAKATARASAIGVFDNPVARPPDTDAGFSLIEVVVALAIFAVLASVVTVNLRGAVLRAQTEAAVQELRTTVATARSLSVDLNRPVGLNALHARLYPDGSQRVRFSTPDIVQPPGLCPEGEATVDVGDGRDPLAWRLRFGTCEVTEVGRTPS